MLLTWCYLLIEICDRRQALCPCSEAWSQLWWAHSFVIYR